jgi:hypothetical protein
VNVPHSLNSPQSFDRRCVPTLLTVGVYRPCCGPISPCEYDDQARDSEKVYCGIATLAWGVGLGVVDD